MKDHETPWGVPDIGNCIWHATGIAEVSTPSHQGIILSEERFAEMSWPFREFQSTNGSRFWEINNDTCIVVAAFLEHFTADRVKWACDLIRTYADSWDDYKPLLDYLPDAMEAKHEGTDLFSTGGRPA